MQFLTSLLGGPGNAFLSSLLALAVVILLILVGLWMFRLILGVPGQSPLARRTGRRLGIVEQLPLDARHRLLIVRRDGVEHLLVTGGAEITVLETAIPAEKPNFPRRIEEAVAAPKPATDLAVRQRRARMTDPEPASAPEPRLGAAPPVAPVQPREADAPAPAASTRLPPAATIVVPPISDPEIHDEPVFQSLSAANAPAAVPPVAANPPAAAAVPAPVPETFPSPAQAYLPREPLARDPAPTPSRGPLRAEIEHLERAIGPGGERVRSLRDALRPGARPLTPPNPVGTISSSIRVSADSHKYNSVSERDAGTGFALDIKTSSGN